MHRENEWIVTPLECMHLFIQKDQNIPWCLTFNVSCLLARLLIYLLDYISEHFAVKVVIITLITKSKCWYCSLFMGFRSWSSAVVWFKEKYSAYGTGFPTKTEEWAWNKGMHKINDLFAIEHNNSPWFRNSVFIFIAILHTERQNKIINALPL